MKSITKGHVAIGLYILFASLFALCLTIAFPQEASWLSPNATMRLPIIAGILAFIGIRFPAVGIGSVFVIVLIEPVMGIDVERMTAEQNSYSLYYAIIMFILLFGVFVGLLSRESSEKVPATT